MTLPSRPAPPTDPLTRKAAATELLRYHGEKERGLNQARTVLIDAARDAGLSWDAIGDALGEQGETLRVRHLRKQGA